MYHVWCDSIHIMVLCFMLIWYDINSIERIYNIVIVVILWYRYTYMIVLVYGTNGTYDSTGMIVSIYMEAFRNVRQPQPKGGHCLTRSGHLWKPTSVITIINNTGTRQRCKAPYTVGHRMRRWAQHHTNNTSIILALLRPHTAHRCIPGTWYTVLILIVTNDP